MQRIISLTKTLLANQIPQASLKTLSANFSLFSNVNQPKLLPTFTPSVNPVCGFKVKGKVRRRCKSCYFVRRQERLYIICPEHPRHKQMAQMQKPYNTWILTHASQSKLRPWWIVLNVVSLESDNKQQI